MNTVDQQDAVIRRAAFSWLDAQVQILGDVLPRALLAEGFDFEDRRVPLLGPQGIFKPAIMGIPISITTIPNGPYDDGYLSETIMQYRYRGTDPQHRDNQGLRMAMQKRIPLIYFYQVVKGKYLALWPVFIVGDDPRRLTFTVQVDDLVASLYSPGAEISQNRMRDDASDLRRAYITATVRQRVHQRAFRERVIQAYHEQCTLCRLKHVELLDAAHIIPDVEQDGVPIVPNGLSLCKLHHAAYDRNFIGIRSDYIVEVRRDILEENDGPMLLHGLKEMHLKQINVPKSSLNRPNPELLGRRFERFLRV